MVPLQVANSIYLVSDNLSVCVLDILIVRLYFMDTCFSLLTND